MNLTKSIIITTCLLMLIFVSKQVQSQPSEFVKRAIITSSVENREPVDSLTNVDSSISKVYFFTEITNKAKTMITHRWFLNGRLEAEVVLKIGSNRWRTYSSKNLAGVMHEGDWTVEVVDENNTAIATTSFSYGN